MSVKNTPILADELIGKNAKVLSSKDQGKSGLSGLIVDETEKMLVIQTGNSFKRIPKSECILEIEGEKIDGKELAFKPHERIKRTWKRLQKWR